MATEQEIKFLQRLAKKGKGAVNVDVTSDVLGLIGFGVQPTNVAIDLAKHNDGEGVLAGVLKDWAKRNGLRWAHTTQNAWALRFEDAGDPKRAADELRELVTMVDGVPTDPQVGRLYMTPLSTTRHDIAVDKVWLGGIGWTLTAPSGKSTTIAAPVLRRGLPVPGPVNLASFWTFLYKNGAAEAAKAYLAEQPTEDIAAATATKAERDKILRRRSALPEIHDLFVALTKDRYDEVVEWLRLRYVGTVESALRIQEKTGKLDSKVWRPLATLGLLKQEYDHDGKLRWVAAPDFEKVALATATLDATAARQNFVDKNTSRISEIAKFKGMVPTATILSVEPGPTFNSRIRFSFDDGSSFELRNKTVWKTSPLGTYFAQFPTTFHDVVLPDGKPMSKPSEARMIDVFATKTNDTAMRRTAARLARGG